MLFRFAKYQAFREAIVALQGENRELRETVRELARLVKADSLAQAEVKPGPDKPEPEEEEEPHIPLRDVTKQVDKDQLRDFLDGKHYPAEEQ